MIESIEGKRGMPRYRPPYVAPVGGFGQPTLVQYVEYCIGWPRSAAKGPEILTSVEKNRRKGLRSYFVSGRRKSPGVHLLPAGATILDVIEVAARMLYGHMFKACQSGEPPSALLPASINECVSGF